MSLNPLARDGLHPNKEFTFKSPRRQAFPYPEGVMTYSIKNAAHPQTYLNFIKTCKKIYPRNRVLLVDDVIYGSDNYQLRNRYDVKKDRCEAKTIPCEWLATNKTKVWILHGLFPGIGIELQGLFPRPPYEFLPTVSNLMQHLYRFDGEMAMLYNQEMGLNEYKKLKNVAYMIVHGSSVKNEDGSMVSDEDLFKPLRYLTKLDM